MAVYTEVSYEELVNFIANYDIGNLITFHGISEGVENSNYLIQCETGNFILTLYEKRTKPEDLPFFLQVMNHLSTRGISCPLPLQSQDGTVLHQLCDRPAALFSFLKGISLRRPKTDHCYNLGVAMGQLHLAGQDLPVTRRNDLSIDGWKELFIACGQHPDTIQRGLGDLITKTLEEISQTWPSHLPQGLIHADLFPDNVFFVAGTTSISGLIDFYFSCTDTLIYDFAITLNAWCFESDGSFNTTRGRALLAGYRSVRPLSPEEFSALPILSRGAALRFLLTRLYDQINTPPSALIKIKNPMEYVQILRFHCQIQSSSQYGLT